MEWLDFNSNKDALFVLYMCLSQTPIRPLHLLFNRSNDLHMLKVSTYCKRGLEVNEDERLSNITLRQKLK
jgi:hypothetical protein